MIELMAAESSSSTRTEEQTASGTFIFAADSINSSPRASNQVWRRREIELASDATPSSLGSLFIISPRFARSLSLSPFHHPAKRLSFGLRRRFYVLLPFHLDAYGRRRSLYAPAFSFVELPYFELTKKYINYPRYLC